MALRISVGQYYAADSPIHRLDPRTKAACAVALMVATFFVHGPLSLVALVACVLALLSISRVPAGEVLDSVRGVFWVLLLLALFNLFLVREGDVLLSAGTLTITRGGAWAAVLYPVRVLAAILAGALLLLTTTPTELGDAFDAFCSPLTRIGLPGHELAMVFSLMLRFIPTLADDAAAITDAQTARGGEVSSGSPVQRLRALGSVLVALMASSMHHADDLARALDARCYVGGATRSHWHPLKFATRDAIAVAITAAMTALLVAL